MKWWNRRWENIARTYGAVQGRAEAVRSCRDSGERSYWSVCFSGLLVQLAVTFLK